MHQCKTLLIHCMDFRFMKGIRGFLDQNNLTGDCDLVSVAGSIKNLVDSTASTSEQEFILKQVSLSHDLHEIKQLILMNHLDCGGYGGAKAFPTGAAEHERHLADLRKARSLIQQKYPELQIKLVLAKLGEQDDVSFEYLD